MDIKIDAIGTIREGTYSNIKIDGVCSVKGTVTADNISIDGVFNCSGSLKVSELFECDGVANVSEPIYANHVNIDGVINFSKRAKLEANDIYCDGVLNSKTEINADHIEVDGCINASEIFGDYVKITSSKGLMHSINLGFNFIKQNLSRDNSDYVKRLKKHSHIGTIEATTIILKGVSVNQVNGHDIVIGEDCDIEHIDCSGTVRVHPSSRVGAVSGAEIVNDNKV